jgi:hypothetical protein
MDQHSFRIPMGDVVEKLPSMQARQLYLSVVVFDTQKTYKTHVLFSLLLLVRLE